MKVILYMAISLDGFIAHEDDDTSWISGEEWASYSKAVRRAGNVVVGRRTYEILMKQPESKELKDVKFVVVSEKNIPMIYPNHLCAASPHAALSMLKDCTTVIIAGGSILNSSFLREHLIDEMYIDIEPIILGKGIKLFSDELFDRKIELLGVNYISKNEPQLHYRIKK